MVEASEKEGRLILTTDKVFLRGGYTDSAYFVKAPTKGEQLQEVLAAFNIQLDADLLLTRCSHCNSEFIPRCASYTYTCTCGVCIHVCIGCMCICVYVCICICAYVCMYTRMHVYVYIGWVLDTR